MTHTVTVHSRDTRRPRPNILIIAGLDSSGMAGVIRDAQAVQAMGGHPAIAISANTVQTRRGVVSINPTDPEIFEQHLDNAPEEISAIKIGMIASTAQIDIIARWLAKRPEIPVILDPVFFASSSDTLVDSAVPAHIGRTLLPHCDLLTPNFDELALLSTIPVSALLCSDTVQQATEDACDVLFNRGLRGILVKGGHGNGSQSIDFLRHEQDTLWLSSPRVSLDHCRGTGCTLASAIATAIGLGYAMKDAVVIGKMAINQALRQSYGPAYLTHFPDQEQDLPKATTCFAHTQDYDNVAFATTERPGQTPLTPLGLYPVVDSVQWLKRLLPLGVTTAQIRIKHLSGAALAEEIQAAINLAKDFSCRLFINDYWELAIRFGAYGVHLGQEDLTTTNIDKLRKSGLRLGVSTHNHSEVALVRWLKPSYIACGPVYATQSKQMPWIPHGPEGLSYWCTLLSCPVVAIGGINTRRLASVLGAGAEGVAMISAITDAPNPEQHTQQLLTEVDAQWAMPLRNSALPNGCATPVKYNCLVSESMGRHG